MGLLSKDWAFFFFNSICYLACLISSIGSSVYTVNLGVFCAGWVIKWEFRSDGDLIARFSSSRWTNYRMCR